MGYLKALLIQKVIIPYLMEFVLNMLTPENLQKCKAYIMNFILKIIAKTETKWDDEHLKPIVIALFNLDSGPADSGSGQAVHSFVLGFFETLRREVPFKVYGDQLFDMIDKAAIDSENTLDDQMILPFTAGMRQLLDIPDLPD